MKSSNIKYMPALDHLRFFAVIVVAIYHGILIFGGFFRDQNWVYTDNPVYALFIEGHTAVTLFMVLSGFIFTYGALGRKISYFGFLKNRFLRIYPLFLALIVLGIFLYPNRFDVVRFLRTVFLLANTSGALEFGSITTVFWTISVEFQFYLIFPFLLRLMNRWGAKALVPIIAVAIISRGVAVYYGFNIVYLTFFTIFGRIDQFIIGMLSAKAYSALCEKGTPFSRRLSLVVSVFLAVFVVFAFNKLGGLMMRHDWKIFWPPFEGLVWAFFLVSYAITVKENTNMIASAMSKMGEWSYSFYLIHFSVWALFVSNGWIWLFGEERFVEVAFVNSLLFIIPATLVISAVTYNLIERPFLKMRGKYLKP